MYEVKSDGKAGFLRSGNVCIQIANDAATTGGWLQDLQDPTKRHVDYLTFMLCSDRDCAQPYGAITIAVPELCQKCGCPTGGCPACQRCRPGEPNWQYRAFTKYRIAQGATLLLPLLD